jgi:hypothetical protein
MLASIVSVSTLHTFTDIDVNNVFVTSQGRIGFELMWGYVSVDSYLYALWAVACLYGKLQRACLLRNGRKIIALKM